MEKTPFSRDIPVDVLRGLAITLMIMANLTPALLLLPPPYWYRVLASLAAPVFILISGMMVALSLSGKGRSLGYMAIRGGLIILIGVLLDTCVWNVVPFIGVDVLYLIGLGLPIACLYLMLPERKRWIIIIGVIGLTPILQILLGYHEIPPNMDLSALWGSMASNAQFPAPTDIAKSWIIDGWFPIFPWIAFSLLGAEIGAYRWKRGKTILFRFASEGLYGIGLLMAGGIVWALFPGPHYIREGYVELFYPPTLGFLLFCIGFFIVALTLLDNYEKISYLDPLRAMGECALFIYIVHYIIIAWVIGPLDLELPILSYLAVYLILLAGMVLLAYMLRRIKKSWHNQPFLVRFLIGG